MDLADTRDDACRGDLAGVWIHGPGGPQVQLKEGSIRIQQRLQPLADGKTAEPLLALVARGAAALAYLLFLDQQLVGQSAEVLRFWRDCAIIAQAIVRRNCAARALAAGGCLAHAAFPQLDEGATEVQRHRGQSNVRRSFSIRRVRIIAFE